MLKERAMASSDCGKEAELNVAPEVFDTKRLLLKEVSLAEDSGWRDLDEDRVRELVSNFKDGAYLLVIMQSPAVLCVDSKPAVSSVDGKYVLCNGKSTMAALVHLALEYEVAKLKSQPTTWAQGLLLKALVEGPRVDFVNYQGLDPVFVTAWQGMCHDQDSNVWRPTSLATKAFHV